LTLLSAWRNPPQAETPTTNHEPLTKRAAVENPSEPSEQHARGATPNAIETTACAGAEMPMAASRRRREIERRTRRRLAALGVLALAALPLAWWAAVGRLAKVGDCPDERYRRALAAMANDAPDSARAELPHLQKASGYHAHASVISGLLLLDEQRLDEALKQFQTGVEHPETRVLAWTLGGRTLLQQGRFADAERALKAGLAEDSHQAELHRLLAAVYYETGELPKALEHLERSAELAPSDPRPHRFMATIARGAGQLDAASKYLSEALRRDAAGTTQMAPQARRELTLELARVRLELSQFDEALATARKLPESPDVLIVQAQCHYEKGEAEAARECLTRASQLGPERFESWMVRGHLAMADDEFSDALECFQQALEHRPLDQGVHYLLSQCYRRLGRDDRADEHDEKARQIKDQTEEFMEMSRRAVREPKTPELCFRLGQLAERIGQNTTAAYWYRATLLLDPKHAAASKKLEGSRE
jgi:tetratricopeptide (TPR) repeat protein